MWEYTVSIPTIGKQWANIFLLFLPLIFKLVSTSLPSHYITVTQFQYILLHRDLRQTKEGLSYDKVHIYIDVDECWLTSSMPPYLIYANIEQNAFSWCVVDGHVSFNLVGVHITLVLPYSINNDTHAWRNKDYNSPLLIVTTCKKYISKYPNTI